MAVALTHFRGFCGFLPHPTLLLLLTTVPEMRPLIGTDALKALAEASEPALPFPNPDAEDYKSTVQELEKLAQEASSSERDDSFETSAKEKEALKRVFEILMNSSEEQYTAALRAQTKRYESDEPACETEFEKTLIPLVKELNGQFPDDIGVLCCFVLNVVEMEKGSAMFLKADEPHAYISGGELFLVSWWVAQLC
jgi:mannose-6-phosphate isomerase